MCVLSLYISTSTFIIICFLFLTECQANRGGAPADTTATGQNDECTVAWGNTNREITSRLKQTNMIDVDCLLCWLSDIYRFHCACVISSFLVHPICLGVCNHAFHFHCITRWLRTRPSCPLDNIDWEFQKASGDKMMREIRTTRCDKHDMTTSTTSNHLSYIVTLTVITIVIRVLLSTYNRYVVLTMLCMTLFVCVCHHSLAHQVRRQRRRSNTRFIRHLFIIVVIIVVANIVHCH